MLAKLRISQRLTSHPTYYWIDALCVDQENIFERNSQVAKMAEIYKRAYSVVVWLGKEDEYTTDALTTIERISAVPEEVWPLVPYTSFYEPSQAVGYSHPNLSYYNWLGFMALINRPWFKRAWVRSQAGKMPKVDIHIPGRARDQPCEGSLHHLWDQNLQLG
jgi:hypothetical protein